MTVMTDLKKIFYAIFLFFAFSNTASYSEVVNKIKVTGNERISKETIVIFGDIALGDLKEGFWRELTKKEKEYFKKVRLK